MAKKADRYFDVNEWLIIENGFDPEYGEVAESIYSLGNEYMGVRGYFEEGYSGQRLLGSYFNGVYEKVIHDDTGYKGIAKSTEYMVNSVDWLYTRIRIGGEELDLNRSEFYDFYRELDLKTGILTRRFVWRTKEGKEIKITFERFLSMREVSYGVQKLSFCALNFTGDITLTLGIDFSVLHQSTGKNMWEVTDPLLSDYEMELHGYTLSTKKELVTTCKIAGNLEKMDEVVEDKCIANIYKLSLLQGTIEEVTKINNHQIRYDQAKANDFAIRCKEAKAELSNQSYEQLKTDTILWWKEVWKTSDIQIRGDSLNQQGIRFCIFQMLQTYHGAVPGANIGAKGLTGEAYNGNTFWDTETYCLPFYLFNRLEAAKNLLLYRYQTLEKAKERAKVLDCKGAFYPIATISGDECCNLWQHASLQLQASTGVAYGIWFYVKQTLDYEFLYTYGIEMLTEISRMLVSRGNYDADGMMFGYYCVMGPDEFQMMVNHNCYTNLMAKFVLNYTCKVWDEFAEKCPEHFENMCERLGVSDIERNNWRQIAVDMYIPYDEERKLFEQHKGFFELPHVDVDQIPVEDFPLYSHWSYDRIYRNDMIKQPDVLMFLLLFNSKFTTEQIKANYEFYEPKCIHESSLSPSVHSILACQIKKYKEAYHFFQFATRLDLDNYNRNSKEGLHITSIAAAWMNIIYGFGGMRSDGKELQLNPTIPAQWDSYCFHITLAMKVIEVTVDQQSVILKTIEGETCRIMVYGEIYQITSKEIKITIPKEWMVGHE